jgi:methylmalonyl-CoA mutase
MDLNAVSSLRMMTVKDPWVNILRGTAACMAAGIGGAQSITLMPHDTFLGMPSDFARRIARNIQIICIEESGIANVSDSAAGSYAFETLTLDLADKAWSLFQEIEGEGGIAPCLKTGKIQKMAADMWDVRKVNLAKRRDAITGVSEFPNLHEEGIADMVMNATFMTELSPAGETIEPLPFHRQAEGFEALRAKSDQMLFEKGQRPSVFLANIGQVADHTARASFAKNFFEAGGIEALSVGGFKSTKQLIEKYKEKSSQLAVICGSDAGYEAHAAEFATALKAAGCKRVYLAGKATIEGVDDCIHVGANLIDALSGAYNALGDMS